MDKTTWKAFSFCRMGNIKENLYAAYGFVKRNPISMVSVSLAFIVSLLAFDYIDCIGETCWTLTIWDAFFEGRLLEYSEVTYENLRGAPLTRDTGGFMALLPWAVWNFPLWALHPTPDGFNIDNPAYIIWSKLFLILCLVLSSYYIKKLSYRVTGNYSLSEYTFILSLTAGTAILSVGYAGQNEIIYVVTFLASVCGYLDGHKIVPAALMIYSLGCFPVLVIPLLIILLNKNLGVVKSFLIVGIELLLGMFIFGLGGAPSEVGSYGSIEQYINMFFEKESLLLSVAFLLAFIASVIAILIACICRKHEDPMESSIIYSAFFFISMLLFCPLHFYRIYVCFPALILLIAILSKRDESLLKPGLIAYTIINYLMVLLACQDQFCWNYPSFHGFLSQYLSYDYPYNFLWLLFGNNQPNIVIVPSLLVFGACIFYIYAIVKKPKMSTQIAMNDSSMVILNALCPMVLILAYFLVPIVV